MRAYLSDPDSGVRGLRPDLYSGDGAWLARTALDEARRILDETEPDGPGSWSGHAKARRLPGSVIGSLYSALAAVTRDGGPLDELAWESVAPLASASPDVTACRVWLAASEGGKVQA